MHFICFFENTPFNKRISIKALTSQGKRFDVVCRMIKAALKFDGTWTRNSIEIWFAGDREFPRNVVRIVIDGAKLAEDILTGIEVPVRCLSLQ